MKSWKSFSQGKTLSAVLFQKKEAETAKESTEAGDSKTEKKLFTRGRGMLQPSLGLGGRRAGLAGGGVSRPTDKLDSGELMGVSVTEEISRQESDLTP